MASKHTHFTLGFSWVAALPSIRTLLCGCQGGFSQKRILLHQTAVQGFEQSVENAYLKRIDHRTPIKGLYLASAWCNPGGGFAGVLLAGQLAFKKMSSIPYSSVFFHTNI